MPGPLQVIAISFGPGSDFHGRVLAEVDRLQGRGVLRLLDLLFVSKRDDGTIERTVIGDDDFGALLSRIVPLGGAGLVEPAPDGSSGFDPTDAQALAHSLLPGTALAFLLIEHGWAQPLFDAIADTGGELLGEGFLTAEAGLVVGAEVAAMGRGGGGDCGRARCRGRRDAPGDRGRDASSRRDRSLGSDSCRCGGRRCASAHEGRHHRGGSHPRGY